jgi:hypothetical protein
MVIRSKQNRRRTDNSMTKGEQYKRQTMVHKTRHRKLKIGQHEPHGKPVVIMGVSEG